MRFRLTLAGEPVKPSIRSLDAEFDVIVPARLRGFKRPKYFGRVIREYRAQRVLESRWERVRVRSEKQRHMRGPRPLPGSEIELEGSNAGRASR